MHPASRPAALVPLLLGVLASSAAAQTVRGLLVEQSTGSAIEGAMVWLIDDAGNQATGALSGTDGRFFLRADRPGTFTLRAERIGYDDAVSDAFTLAEGEYRDVRLEASQRAIALPSVIVEGEQRCELRPREGAQSARLWEEARKALNAVAWTRDQRLYRYQIRRFERELELDGRTVRREQSRIRTLEAADPFRALSPAVLQRHGYIQRAADGGHHYYAPDAQLLLSNEFLDGHCFRPRLGAGDRAGLIGLAFEPVSGTRVADIEGVLWLDAATAELRFIEYGYTRLPYALPRGGLGGRIDLDRLANGAWIVSSWRIRMPGVAMAPADLPGPRERLIAIHETGGELVSLEPATAGTEGAAAAIAGVAFDSLRAEPLAGAVIYISGSSHATEAGDDGRFHLSDLPAGRVQVSIGHPRIDSLGVYPVPLTLELEPGDIASVTVALPGAATLHARVCPDAPAGTGAVGGRVYPADSTLPRAGVEVVAMPIDGAATRETSTISGPSGHYVLCGVPAGSVTIRARARRAEGAAVRVTVRPSELATAALPVVRN